MSKRQAIEEKIQALQQELEFLEEPLSPGFRELSKRSNLAKTLYRHFSDWFDDTDEENEVFNYLKNKKGDYLISDHWYGFSIVTRDKLVQWLTSNLLTKTNNVCTFEVFEIRTQKKLRLNQVFRIEWK